MNHNIYYIKKANVIWNSVIHKLLQHIHLTNTAELKNLPSKIELDLDIFWRTISVKSFSRYLLCGIFYRKNCAKINVD